MGFGGGDSGEEVRPLMNVVPFIDIMLVLLVVFMLAVPALQKSSADQNPADKSSEVSDTGRRAPPRMKSASPAARSRLTA